MQQQIKGATNNRKRDQEHDDDHRRHRKKLNKLERRLPPPSPCSSEEDNCELEHDDHCDPKLLASGDEIVFSTTTNKMNPKMGANCLDRTSPRLVMETECDEDDGKRRCPVASGVADEEASVGRRTELLLSDSQLVGSTDVATTLSPSPSPTPLPMTSPPPSPPSPSSKAIDLTTTTTTNTTTPSAPESLIEERCVVSPALTDRHNSSSRQQQQHHHHSIMTKLTKQQLEHLDSLVEAIKRGNFADFCHLMEERRGFKRNLLNVFVDGNTALHYSLMYGRSLKWCKQLILNGANPNLANRYGWHSMHLAAYSCSSDILSYITDCVVASEQLA